MMSRRVLLAGAIASFVVSSFAHGQQLKIPRVGVLWHAASVEEESPFFGSLPRRIQERRLHRGI